MARRAGVVLTCDVHDGVAEAAGTVALALDGEVFECDLCASHLSELRRTVGLWSAHARRVATASELRRGVGRARPAGTLRGPRRTALQPGANELLERMLVASEEVFSELGYEATTTNLIAAQAGTSIGSVYNFLGSKEEIAIALFERYLTELRPRFGDVAAGVEGVSVLVDIVDSFLRGHPALHTLLRHRLGGDDLRATRRRFQAILADALEQLIDRQRPFADPVRRRTAAEMCAGMIWSVVDDAADLPRRRRPARVAELKLLLTGYLVGVAAA